MTAAKACCTVALLGAMLWAGSGAGAGFGQSPTTTQAWRQFSGAATTASSQSSGWHYFGSASPTSKTSTGDSKTYSLPRAKSVSALEREMCDFINRDRLDPANTAETGGRAQPLRWNEALAAVAREHSRDMLQQKFFAHVDRAGRSPATRVKAAGIAWQSVGENIAIYDTVPGAQTAFMNEPRFGHNHRSNILDRKYTDVGVGIIQAPDGRYYITQEFVQSPRSLRASF